MSDEYSETYIYCDNQAVVNNASNVDSTLNKKHSEVAYHFVRWNVAARVVKLGWIDTHEKASSNKLRYHQYRVTTITTELQITFLRTRYEIGGCAPVRNQFCRFAAAAAAAGAAWAAGPFMSAIGWY